jgi:uncharacterized protein UPF0158
MAYANEERPRASSEVSLRQAVTELGMVSIDCNACLDLTTGTFLSFPVDGPEEQQDEFDAALDSGRFLPLPDAFDIDEHAMLRRFARSRPCAEQRDALLWAIRGRGAFRCFKDTARRLGLIETWNTFRERQIAALAVEWLEKNGVPYRRDLQPWGTLRSVS